MIYMQVEMHQTELAGEVTDWEEIPAEGLPDWGYDPDALVMVDATLTMMENTGCPSIAFANDIYTISFTHDPAKVV